ncbi:MAG TPA: universal stress protein [Streptosporangiaceae bacterium]|nr:universal stress protein [Streptosporangiaceae bacterium]
MSGIVVGVDGSTGSHEALGWAAREAAVRHAPLTVVTVHPVMASAWTGNPVILAPDEPALKQVRAAAEEAVAKTTSQLGDAQPASVTVKAVNGFIAEELIGASRDADVLVVGSRGAGGFASLRLGSVASQLVHHSACPVVIVPSGR